MTANIGRLAYFETWIDPVAEKMLRARADIDLVRLEYTTPEPDNWRELGRAHGYQISARGDLREPWLADAKLLAKCQNLLAVSSTGVGYDVIDVAACTAAGVIVCNQSGSNKEAVAEHALGLILSLSKKIAVADRAVRRADSVDRYTVIGSDIRNKTVGIIGIGQIGTRVAELCRGLFGMTVLAYDPYLTADQVVARGATKVELDDLLRRSDYVTVHCPRTEETFGMLGSAKFALMKRTAYFINTARGGTYEEAELAEALEQKRIAGAGLDVFLKEPPPADHPLMAFDNVIITPHIAGVTNEALHDMAASAAEQWIFIFSGAVPRSLVNPEAWTRYAERFERLLGIRPQPLPLGA